MSGILTTQASTGTINITFISGPFHASAPFNVQNLMSLTIAPLNPTTTVGNTRAFTATAHNCDGSTPDVTAAASWTVNDSTIAAVTANGSVQGVADGSTNVTATYLASSASTGINVGLTSISVSPAPITAPVGTQISFSALGSFDDSSSRNVTLFANWGPSGNPVVQIDNTGYAQTLQQGTATITADSAPAVQGTSSLTVGPAQLKSIDVGPPALNILNGDSVPFGATGNYNDGSTQDLTLLATWNSSNTTIATITSGDFGGVATGDASNTGTTQITAQYIDPNWPSGGTIGSNVPAQLTVGAPALLSISVSPQNPVAGTSTTLQFTARGNYSDGSTQDLTAQALWSSNNSAIATINTAGLATTKNQPGTATIGATVNQPGGPFSDSTLLTVTAATVTKIDVTPTSKAIDVALTQQFTATATYSDSSTKDVTSQAIWQSSVPTIATISAGGLATALLGGSTNITAKLSNVTSTAATLTVNPPTTLTVNPASATVLKNASKQFAAMATFTDTGAVLKDLTDFSSWNSDAPAISVVNNTNNKGLAVGLSAGTAHITATQSGVPSAPASITVFTAQLQSITIAPLNANLALNHTLQYTAIGHYSDNSTQNLTNSVTWSSSQPTVGTISASGLAKAKSLGTTTIKAVGVGNLSSGPATLTVIF